MFFGPPYLETVQPALRNQRSAQHREQAEVRLAMGTHCSCGAAIVARTIRPGTIMSRALAVPGLVIEETCAVGHVANFTATSLTMTELAAALTEDELNFLEDERESERESIEGTFGG